MRLGSILRFPLPARLLGGGPSRQPQGGTANPGPPGLKQPWLALLFSILFSGLGQLYNGQIMKGLLFVALQVVNFALITWFIGLLTAPAFWLYAMFDALDTTERINARRIKDYVDARYGDPEAKARRTEESNAEEG